MYHISLELKQAGKSLPDCHTEGHRVQNRIRNRDDTNHFPIPNKFRWIWDEDVS